MALYDHYDAHGLPTTCDKAEAEVRDLRAALATCGCGTHPETYEGPQADCPVHGAIRAFIDAVRENERLRAEFVPAIRENAPLHQHTCGYIEELSVEDVAAGQKCPWCSEHGESEWWPLYRRQRAALAADGPTA